jgi:ankyrin repeat protein
MAHLMRLSKLILAVKEHKNRTLESMLKKGRFDMNGIWGPRFTPLFVAVMYGNEYAVRLLLNYGADPNKRMSVSNGCIAGYDNNECDFTPLSLAIIRNVGYNKDIASILVYNGAKFTLHGVDLSYFQGLIALFEVIKREKPYSKSLFWVFPMFIEKGVDINAQRDDGATFLTLAVDISDNSNNTNDYKADLYAIVEVLLKHGADPNIPGKGGKYALDIALENERHDIVTLLFKNRAKNTAGVRHCQVCLHTNIKLYQCSGCHNGKYCSDECHRIDWKNGHKQECKKKKPLMSEID